MITKQVPATRFDPSTVHSAPPTSLVVRTTERKFVAAVSDSDTERHGDSASALHIYCFCTAWKSSISKGFYKVLTPLVSVFTPLVSVSTPLVSVLGPFRLVLAAL